MSRVSEPLLVYNRIDANRRRTRQLLALFAVAVLPFASGATVWLGLPLVFIVGLFSVLGVPALQDSMDGTTLQQAILVQASLIGLALVLSTLGLVAITVAFVYASSNKLVLRAARARPVARRDEPGLHRIVEILCVGAGLPKPELHVIESSMPNAFATGREPRRAALVVTRGLLTLLGRRELEGVVAHELSHIGNQDIRLQTTLAGLAGTLTLPLTVVMAVLRSHPLVAGLAVAIAVPMASGLLMVMWVGLTEAPRLFRESTGQPFPPVLWWWGLHSMATPFYMVLIAPVMARLLKRAVSREREFLADADAVTLTRNPEALALALVKVASATGSPIGVGPATTHLYFVDPIPDGGPWLAGWFRSHPPVADRLDVLGRMGSGIAASAVQEAVSLGVARGPVGDSAQPATTVRSRGAFGRYARRTFHPALVIFAAVVLTRLWRGPLGFADLLVFVGACFAFWYYTRHRSPSADRRGAATVATPPQLEQSISSGHTPGSPGGQTDATEMTRTFAISAEEADLGERLRLAEPTTLYSRPDGWSDVVEELPKGMVVRIKAWDTGFARVDTESGRTGYVGRRTRLVPLRDG